MAGFHDRRAAQDATAARARIEAIYSNRGLPTPANIDAQVQRAMSSGGNYFDQIRSHADRNAANPGELTRFNQNYQAPISNKNPQPKPSPPGGTIHTSPGNLSPGSEPTSDPTPARDWRSEAMVERPWLSGRLLDLFAEFWDETGNPATALVRLRGTSEYAAFFPGIRRDDGTLRMDENQYLADREGVAEVAAEFGFDPTSYRKMYPQMVELGIDASEFGRAAQESVTRFTEPGGQRTELADMFLKQFLGTGSQQVALENVRSSSQYDKVFAGNRREDGTLRMDEPGYFAYKRGWYKTIAGFGINPQELEARGRFRASVEGELSINEVGNRLQSVQDGILDNIGAVQEFYASNYGLDLTPGAILGMAIDPSVQRDVLERKVSAAQIGGEAAVRGFTRSVERAEELARAGIGQGQARQLYTQAGQQLAGLSATTRRFNRGDTTITDFEDAIGLGDAAGTSRLQSALREESSSFTGRSDTRRSRDGFGLSGLRQR